MKLKCKTNLDVNVWYSRKIGKNKFTFNYTFFSKRNKLELRCVVINTTSKIYSSDLKNETKTVVFVSSSYCRNELHTPSEWGEKQLIRSKEISKIIKLSDVKVPKEVTEAAHAKLKRIKG